MLYKWIREYITKYSFINRTEFKNAYVYIYYDDLDGKERYKRLPYRTTRDQLIRIIERIKEEIDYERRVQEYYEENNMSEQAIFIHSMGETTNEEKN